MYNIGDLFVLIRGAGRPGTDHFWQARGVSEPDQRQALVALAGARTEEESLLAAQQATTLQEGIFCRLGGLEARSEVQAISARLLALRTLLGKHEDVDIVWMVERAPRLLTADLAPMAQQLLNLRMSMAKSERGIVKLIERSPSLLLQKPQAHSPEESDQDREAALRFGLMSDAEADWQHRYRQLDKYCRQHGDSHIGFRDGDERHWGDLSRWAAKQRAAWKSRSLQPHRELKLVELEFEFDEEEARWLRWYSELVKLYSAQGPGFAIPLARSSDLYLDHWCSVQRISRRSGVISQRHYALLEQIAFDWSGADALS
ncbi:hypothetical protein WJX73_008860 [Symbiochloris irregularis]|uniref:Helicase-associated domain-containing protein n=1 Tax=Symbiochloris irregularis TaxID=706552 RepID=A0AAW1NXU2_9CHLO